MVTAAQGGLFTGMGQLNPHAYRPNEFITQNWVYEGLVGIGPKGDVVPALAESWTVEDKAITFLLRRGVKFYDGEAWNAQAAKANFDNILAGPLKDGYHGWYDLPKYITGWEVVDDYTFRLRFSINYYPALQELAIIRPIRFISPKSLPTRPDEKSCPPVTKLFWQTNATEFRCVGITTPAGTGPLIFVKKVTNQRTIMPQQLSTFTAATDEIVQEIHFDRNKAHWDTAAGNINTFIIKLYPSLAAVQAALRQREVELVFGLDTVDPVFFRDLHQVDTDHLNTFISGPLNTRVVELNSGKSPTNSLAVRRAISHAIKKQAIIRKELAGLEQPAFQLFSRTMPYCDVDLSPPIDYDKEKVVRLLDDAGWVLPPGGKIRQRNGTQLDGDFHLVFSHNLGAPYDPHSSASYWTAWGGHIAGFSGLSAQPITEGFALDVPANTATLYAMIEEVLSSTNDAARAAQWAKILTVVHEQALFVPISYLVNVAVLDNRYENFAFGGQQWTCRCTGLWMGSCCAARGEAAAPP